MPLPGNSTNDPGKRSSTKRLQSASKLVLPPPVEPTTKGVLFVTIEDETGVAQGILWPDRFEIYRRQVMSASMIAMRGRLQKEGEVIHIICDRIVDHDAMLRSIGRMEFTVAPGRGDGASHGGGPDPRDPAFLSGRTLSPPPFTTRAPQDELLPIRSHDFH